MIVGHTHDNIDALFGRWSMLSKKENFSTIPTLMKSFMDVESIPTIDDAQFIDFFLAQQSCYFTCDVVQCIDPTNKKLLHLVIMTLLITHIEPTQIDTKYHTDNVTT